MRPLHLLVLPVCLCVPLTIAAQAGGWLAKPDVVARTSKQQAGFNFDEARVPAYTLPDPLAGGRARVSTASQWPARRAEILDLFRANVYGRSPGRPEHLAFTTLQEDARAMDGAATLRRVAIASRQGDRSHQFELTLFVPNPPARPVGVFLLINNRGVTNTDPTRRERSGFWPAEQLIARGYGIAAIQYGQLAPDDKDTFRDGAMALFPGAPTWGAIGAWAWGASRAMDYLATDRRIDPRRVAIVGHSRGGKAALWAGAEDERFSLVISNESGEGGAALSRRGFGETVERINTSFPHWFTSTYKSFNGRETELPIDQHMLLALAAPRALYVASADEDLWSDPRGEFLALAAASPVFALWGDPAIRADQMPALDTPFVSGRRGYHVRTGPHNLTPYDWDRFADFADRVWKD
jgi:Prolyl oligopeptidase family